MEVTPTSNRGNSGHFSKGNKIGKLGGAPSHRKPKGGISLTQVLREHFAKTPGEAKMLIQALINLGLKPSSRQLDAINEIFDRLEGKPTERREITGGLPITLRFIPAEMLKQAPEPLSLGPTPEVIEGEVRELDE